LAWAIVAASRQLGTACALGVRRDRDPARSQPSRPER